MTDYQANTVEELRDELRTRSLPTSGVKDELVARLEEDDAAKAGAGEAPAEATEETPAEEAAAEEDEGTPVEPAGPVDPHKMVLHPAELPANPVAAAQFLSAHPEAVSEDVPISDERIAQAAASAEAAQAAAPSHKTTMENQQRTAEGLSIHGEPVSAEEETEQTETEETEDEPEKVEI